MFYTIQDISQIGNAIEGCIKKLTDDSKRGKRPQYAEAENIRHNLFNACILYAMGRKLYNECGIWIVNDCFAHSRCVRFHISPQQFCMRTVGGEWVAAREIVLQVSGDSSPGNEKNA